jgi:hypothetical protein
MSTIHYYDNFEGSLRLKGIHYLDALAALHNYLAPATYLEIGTSRGKSLRAAACVSVAIDPAFDLDGDVVGKKPALHLLRSTSADAFQSGILDTLLPGGADLIFLDGLHSIEAIYDDFLGAERLCHANTVIAVHDVLPVNVEMTGSAPGGPRKDASTASWWTGDVWKIVPILREHRPDLKITAVDCHPTGLLIVQRPDSLNRVLTDRRDQILQKWRNMDLQKFGLSQLYRLACIVPILDPSQLAEQLAIR